jgi:hypothetical protein
LLRSRGRVNLPPLWDASLAQLVEQCFRKAWVAGSNPATGSTCNSVVYTGFGEVFFVFFLH